MKLFRAPGPIGVKAVGVMVAAIVGLAAFAAGALAGDPTTKPTGEFVDLDVNVLPPKTSTAHKLQGSAVDFHLFQGNRKNPSQSETTTDFKIEYPQGFALNGASFPQCKFSTDPQAYSDCPANTSIGTGTAEGGIPDGSGGVTYVPVTLTGYNAGKIAGKPGLIFQAQANGQTVSEFDFQVLHPDNAPVLDDYTLPGTQPSTISFTQFNFKAKDLTTHKNGKTVHLTTNPTTCPKAGWKFTVSETTQEAGTLTATSDAPCTR